MLIRAIKVQSQVLQMYVGHEQYVTERLAAAILLCSLRKIRLATPADCVACFGGFAFCFFSRAQGLAHSGGVVEIQYRSLVSMLKPRIAVTSTVWFPRIAGLNFQ